MKRVIIAVMLLSVALLSGCGSDDTETKWQEQYVLGIQSLYKDEYEEAETAFSSAIEIDENNAKAYIGLADAYIGDNKLTKAEESLSEAIRLVEEGGPVPANLATVQFKLGSKNLAEGKIEKAIEYLEAAIKNGYCDKNVYILLADAYFSAGPSGRRELGKAVQVLEEAHGVLGNSRFIEKKLEEINVRRNALDELGEYLSASNFNADEMNHIADLLEQVLDYNGMCYDGETVLISSSFTGNGLKILKDSCYLGDLRNGEPNGEGVYLHVATRYSLRDGDFYVPESYVGNWEHGEANGHGVYNNGGEIWEGNWVDGYGDGEFTLKDESGLWTMALENGYYVLDDRWVQRSDGDYEITAIENYTEYSGNPTRGYSGDYFNSSPSVMVFCW